MTASCFSGWTVCALHVVAFCFLFFLARLIYGWERGYCDKYFYARHERCIKSNENIIIIIVDPCVVIEEGDEK